MTGDFLAARNEDTTYLALRRRLSRPTMPNPSASEIQVVGSGVAEPTDTLVSAKASSVEPLEI
jgi:hypothetical protein